MPHHPVAMIDRNRERRVFALARLASPGFLYNSGNLLGLCVGLAIALAGGRGRSAESIAAYFAGDAGALCLTAATIIFFASGSVYHRAWLAEGRHRLQLVRCGDVLSGAAAILLGASLALVGQPILALASATLHSAGKLGSALAGGRSDEICRKCRWLVLASRGLGLTASAAGLGMGTGEGFLMPLTLIACYVIWASADFLLMKYAD